jgi:hypothetical protein
MFDFGARIQVQYYYCLYFLSPRKIHQSTFPLPPRSVRRCCWSWGRWRVPSSAWAAPSFSSRSRQGCASGSVLSGFSRVSGSGSGSDLDPYPDRIRIQSGQWIRIRIQSGQWIRIRIHGMAKMTNKSRNFLKFMF